MDIQVMLGLSCILGLGIYYKYKDYNLARKNIESVKSIEPIISNKEITHAEKNIDQKVNVGSVFIQDKPMVGSADRFIIFLDIDGTVTHLPGDHQDGLYN